MSVHSNNIGTSVDVAVGCMQGSIVQHYDLLHGSCFIIFEAIFIFKVIFIFGAQNDSYIKVPALAVRKKLSDSIIKLFGYERYANIWGKLRVKLAAF